MVRRRGSDADNPERGELDPAVDVHDHRRRKSCSLVNIIKFKEVRYGN